MASPLVTAPTVRVYAGDSCSFGEVQFFLEEEPADLTAWSFTSQWRPTADSATALTLTVDVSDSDMGILRISATPTVTSSMGRDGVWDVEGRLVADGTTTVTTFVVGKTKWMRDVTRAR